MRYYILTYSGSTQGVSGEQCKTEYEFTNACQVCGTGAELNGPLRVKGISKTKRDFFETLNGDCIISKSLYNEVVKEIPAFRLEPAVDTKGHPLEFFHFYSKYNLPKSKDTSTGFVREEPCPVCNRNGYYNDVTIGWPTTAKPLDFKYDNNDFINLSDAAILKTWECSGRSNKTNYGNNVIRYARPWIIVREDLKKVFDKEKIKNLYYEQIIIEGSVQQNL
jgi:hypothetical protein